MLFEEVSTTPRLNKEMAPLPFPGCREKMGEPFSEPRQVMGLGFLRNWPFGLWNLI